MFLKSWLVAAALVAVLAGAPAVSHGQSHDELLGDPACLDDPDSEACICARVQAFARYPSMGINSAGKLIILDVDGDGEVPSLNLDTGLWEDHVNTVSGSTDLHTLPTTSYGQNCALSYLREDLRRLWRFAVALGGGLAALSLIWAGFAYMQASASGTDLSRNRAMIIRVLVGVIILACAALIWEMVSGTLLGHLDTWSFRRDVFYDFY